MNDAEIEQMLAKLQSEFKQLYKRRDMLAKEAMQIDRRLVHLTGSIDGLKKLLASNDETALIAPPTSVVDPSKGVTEAIRKLFEENRVLTPTLIRDLLKGAGFEESDNFLVVIHNTLKRMAETGELRPVDIEGKTAYEVRGALERLLFGHATGKTTPVSSHSSKSDAPTIASPNATRGILAMLTDRPTEPSRGSGTRASSGMPPSLRIRKPVGPEKKK